MSPPLAGPWRRTPPTLMALGGPLGRILAQAVVAGIAIVARTLPAAYAAALENARKSGTTAASEGDALNKGASFLGKARMSKEEAFLVLNLTEEEVAKDVASVQRQYDRYFAANAVENGGSFYVQSKVYRAKELLEEYVQEKNVPETNTTGEDVRPKKKE